MPHERYESPLAERYASSEMATLFSPKTKFSTWRRLWVALAEAEQSLGLPISEAQLEQMTSFIHEIDFAKAESYEKMLQHDVMAHIHTYGDQCPLAKPIIHLGATSCFVTDNSDILLMREGLTILADKLKRVLKQLAFFAKEYATLPCLAYTHLQPAQLTTLGKRACLWLQDLLLDYQELLHRSKEIQFLGAKGATGTQASFLSLFDNDPVKVSELDSLIAKKMGFDRSIAISSQTYTRKQDAFIVNALAGIAISAHKFATDLRLLAHLKEVEEPFAEKQVGSSAMPYKRNPILAERICALSRYLIALSQNPAYTASLQWLERTLDDSANRRITLAESFLSCDAILELLLKITAHLVVYPKVIAKHVSEELPFMATEHILMACVKKGGDRQTLHEQLRVHSQAAADRVKKEGLDNDLIERIAGDPTFHLKRKELDDLLKSEHFTGRSAEQTHSFLESELRFLSE